MTTRRVFAGLSLFGIAFELLRVETGSYTYASC